MWQFVQLRGSLSRDWTEVDRAKTARRLFAAVDDGDSGYETGRGGCICLDNIITDNYELPSCEKMTDFYRL